MPCAWREPLGGLAPDAEALEGEEARAVEPDLLAHGRLHQLARDPDDGRDRGDRTDRHRHLGSSEHESADHRERALGARIVRGTLEQLREVDALGVVAVDPDRQVEEVVDVTEVELHVVRRQQVAVLDAGEPERERLGHHLSVAARGHHQGVDPHRRPEERLVVAHLERDEAHCRSRRCIDGTAGQHRALRRRRQLGDRERRLVEVGRRAGREEDVDRLRPGDRISALRHGTDPLPSILSEGYCDANGSTTGVSLTTRARSRSSVPTLWTGPSRRTSLRSDAVPRSGAERHRGGSFMATGIEPAHGGALVEARRGSTTRCAIAGHRRPGTDPPCCTI